MFVLTEASLTKPLRWSSGVGACVWLLGLSVTLLVGCATSLRTDFVLDALEQAIYDRRGDGAGDLVHHSDPNRPDLQTRRSRCSPRAPRCMEPTA